MGENTYASESTHCQFGPELDADEKLARASKVHDACGASFADAREALEACGYDVLDAVVWLEREGRVAAGSAHFSTSPEGADATEAQAMSQAQDDYERSTRHVGFERALARVWGWVKRVAHKGMNVSLVAERRGRKVISLPILVFLALAVLAFWVVVPLVVLSLFFDVRYRFDGLGSVTVDVNEWSRKASDGVEHLKQDVMDEERRQEKKE